ncbi:MAG: GIY-YIG nuclease family protein [Betaproteobacteria bacterium]
MTFWVYILQCNDDSYYTGHTDNLDLRIASHQSGKIDGYTATRLPVELVFSEIFGNRVEALEVEMRIKGWSRKKKEALMRGDWDEVSRLAKNASAISASQPVHGSTGSPRTGNTPQQHDK